MILSKVDVEGKSAQFSLAGLLWWQQPHQYLRRPLEMRVSFRRARLDNFLKELEQLTMTAIVVVFFNPSRMTAVDIVPKGPPKFSMKNPGRTILVHGSVSYDSEV
jgi:hypothetical protein